MAASVYIYCCKKTAHRDMSRIISSGLKTGDYSMTGFDDPRALVKAIINKPCDILVFCADADCADIALVNDISRINGFIRIITLLPCSQQGGEHDGDEPAYLLGSPVKLSGLAEKIELAAKPLRKSGKSLTFRVKGGIETVRFDDIIMLESFARKICAYTVGRKYSAYGSLSAILNDLDERFLQCHKSFIINMDYLDSTNRLTVSLAGGRLSAPISQSRRKQSHEIISGYLSQENSFLSTVKNTSKAY